MSLTRKPLLKTWKEKGQTEQRSVDTEPSVPPQTTATTVDLPPTKQDDGVPDSSETESPRKPDTTKEVSRKRPLADNDSENGGEVEDNKLQEGMCQTWKRCRKNESPVQCRVRPQKGHPKCFSHGTNRREVKDQEQLSCDTCMTMVSKGSMKKHESSNRHLDAEKFASLKQTEKGEEPPCVTPQPEENPELEVPERRVPQKASSAQRTPAGYAALMTPREYSPREYTQSVQRHRKTVAQRQTLSGKDFSRCFGV